MKIKKLVIFGKNSKLTSEIKKHYDHSEIILIDRNDLFYKDVGKWVSKLDSDCFYIFVYLSAILRPAKICEQKIEEIVESFNINCWVPVSLLERLNENPKLEFKYIYVSSESAKKGSYDTSYFLSKCSVEKFIKENRLVNKSSSCIAISPSTIEDSGMTLKRADTARLDDYRKNHPKERFLYISEIVEIIMKFIDLESSYLTNTVIEVNGGKFTRRIIKE